jgi:hypothetical protein
VTGHAARFGSRLDQIYLVPILRRPVSGGQAHRTGSNNNDFSHLWRSLESGEDHLRSNIRQVLNDSLG